jgi:hypothetical protein
VTGKYNEDALRVKISAGMGMNSAKSTRQTKSQGFGSGGDQSSGARRSEFSRHLWKTSALSAIVLAGTGAAHAQDALWQPQVRNALDYQAQVRSVH